MKPKLSAFVRLTIYTYIDTKSLLWISMLSKTERVILGVSAIIREQRSAGPFKRFCGKKLDFLLRLSSEAKFEIDMGKDQSSAFQAFVMLPCWLEAFQSIELTTCMPSLVINRTFSSAVADLLNSILKKTDGKKGKLAFNKIELRNIRQSGPIYENREIYDASFLYVLALAQILRIEHVHLNLPQSVTIASNTQFLAIEDSPGFEQLFHFTDLKSLEYKRSPDPNFGDLRTIRHLITDNEKLLRQVCLQSPHLTSLEFVSTKEPDKRSLDMPELMRIIRPLQSLAEVKLSLERVCLAAITQNGWFNTQKRVVLSTQSPCTCMKVLSDPIGADQIQQDELKCQKYQALVKSWRVLPTIDFEFAVSSDEKIQVMAQKDARTQYFLLEKESDSFQGLTQANQWNEFDLNS